MSRRLATYEWYANCTVYLALLAALALSLAILLGGPRRFSAPSFAVARLIPGEQATWGGILLGLGLIMAFGVAMEWHAHLIMIGFLGMAAWYGFFALTLGVSSFREPSSALTGMCAYGTLSALCVLGWACGEGLRSE